MFGLFFSAGIVIFSSCQSNGLQQQIEEAVASKQAVVGVAIISGSDTVLVNNHRRYPMQSVYKLHLALDVLSMVDSGLLSLSQKIHVDKKDLHPDTYSPLREKYPDGNVDIPLSEVLQYAVSQSDNNACDMLFRLAGGAQKVNAYIRSTGVEGINIAYTEREMHADYAAQYGNYTTPLATALLLEKFYHGQLLSEGSRAFLWRIMAETSTGKNRIPGLLPPEAVVAHKTGTGGKKDGVTAACNDVGIVQIDNNKHVTIVVLVAESRESDSENERIIAEVARLAWDYFTSKE